MAFEHPGNGALDYLPCKYGESKLPVRGPRKDLEQPYIAFLGSTETYGRFIEQPFPDLIGDALDQVCVNLGCVNGGIDVYNNDPTLLSIASRSRATVVQIMGAHNLSNRFYSVHPRRNDRFVGPSSLMQTIFKEVDFTEFTFTRHLMSALQLRCEQRFGRVIEELRSAWVARMRSMLGRIDGPKILLWIADHRPEEAQGVLASYGNDPLYVDRSMIEALAEHADDCAEIIYDPGIRGTCTEGMVFSELEAPAAMQIPGVEVHHAVARELAGKLAPYFA